jgi:ABC-type enterobactin transport system permease subunit
VVLGSGLAGAALVVGADALVKTFPTRAGNMPIGIVTALVGGVSFIVLLRAERRR